MSSRGCLPSRFDRRTEFPRATRITAIMPARPPVLGFAVPVALSVAALAAACAYPRPARDAAIAPAERDAAVRAVGQALDDLHASAARADEAAYFAHFADDGVFLGTDSTERWDVPAFRAYAHPRFAAGKAWTFRATRRAILISADGALAWFDEDLATERLGPAR